MGKYFKLKVFRLLTGITGTALNKDNTRQFLRKGAHCGVHALQYLIGLLGAAIFDGKEKGGIAFQLVQDQGAVKGIDDGL